MIQFIALYGSTGDTLMAISLSWKVWQVGRLVELVHFKAHPVVDLVVRKRDVILVYGVPARRQSVSRTPQSQIQKKKGEWQNDGW